MVREPGGPYSYGFDAQNSGLSHYRRLILEESCIKVGGCLGRTPSPGTYYMSFNLDFSSISRGSFDSLGLDCSMILRTSSAP